jgi:hypothetical protein
MKGTDEEVTKFRETLARYYNVMSNINTETIKRAIARLNEYLISSQAKVSTGSSAAPARA